MSAPETRRGDQLHRALIAELGRAGCFRPAPLRTLAYGVFVVVAYAAAWATLLAGPGIALRVVTLAGLAVLCVHAGFMAHEAGHGAITRNRRAARAIAQVFDTLLSAMSASYFSHIHRRHHLHTNDRARDPDIQSDHRENAGR